jgi:hypothetical protein
LLVLLEEAVQNRRRPSPRLTPERQRKLLRELEPWEDSRTAAEIIADIYETRTPGRDVTL